MTYKQALQLKKAGFPQQEGFLCEPRKNKEAIYFPTLEEIIEELGDKLVKITNTTDGWYIYGGKECKLFKNKDLKIALINLYIKLKSN